VLKVEPWHGHVTFVHSSVPFDSRHPRWVHRFSMAEYVPPMFVTRISFCSILMPFIWSGWMSVVDAASVNVMIEGIVCLVMRFPAGCGSPRAVCLVWFSCAFIRETAALYARGSVL